MAPSNARLRLVVLGGAGAGKTTTANAILGQDAFQEAETMESSVQTRNVRGRCISLIDTPRSLLGSSSSGEQQNRECLKKCLSLAAPGPHAFLLVIPLGTSPDSDEGARVVEWIGHHLGEEALRMTVVLFTRRERVARREWDHFLLRQEVQHLIRSVGGGYHTLNSKAEVVPCQITELLETVDAMVGRSGGKHYTTDMKFLHEAQRRGERKEDKVSALLEKEEKKWGERRREMEMRKQKREEEKRRVEEERKRQEEERKKKELWELEERERRRKRREERERVERERRTLEEMKNRQQQERQRLLEEERRQEEARQRLLEERRQQEEEQERLEEERRQQEEVARRLEQERERQEQETLQLVQERRKRETERMREEQDQQVGRGGGGGRGGQQKEDDGWWRTAERCAAIAGAFLAPFMRR